MSRPLCTIDSAGKNRYFIDGKRVSNQAFTQHFPNFDHERGCLPVRQRVNLLKRLAPTVMVHRDLLENNLIGGILEEVENLRRNVALFDQYKIDIERQSSSAREEVRAEFQARMDELSIQLAEHLQLLQQKESSNMELQTTISGLRESLDLCESAKESMSGQFATIQGEKAQLEAQMKELEASLRSNIASLQSSLETSANESGDLRKAVEGLKQSLRDCKSTRKDAEFGLKSCSEEVKSMGNKYMDLESTYGVEKTLWGQERDGLQTRLREMESGIAASLKQVEDAQSRERNIEGEAIDLRKAVAGLKNSLKECKAARKDAEFGLKSCSEEVKSMGSKYMDLESTHSAEKTLLEQKLREVESNLSATIKGLQTETADLGKAAEDLRESLRVSNEAREAAERQSEYFKERNEASQRLLRENVDRYATDVTAAEEKNAELEALLDSFKSRQEQSILRIEELVKELSTCRSTGEQNKERLAKLQLQSDAYLGEIGVLKQAKDDSVRESAAIIQQLKEESAKKELLLKQEEEELRRKIDDAETRLAAAGDICFVSEENARVCLDKIRAKYPNVVAVIPGVGVMTSAGDILPTSLPKELESVETVPISTEDEKEVLEVIPVQPTKMPIVASVDGLKISSKKKNKKKGGKVEVDVPVVPVAPTAPTAPVVIKNMPSVKARPTKLVDRQTQCIERGMAYSERTGGCVTYEELEKECKKKGMSFNMILGGCSK